MDSLTVALRKGKPISRLTVTLDVPEPAAVHPVGIDLNETNALVAVDPDGRTLFISSKAVKVKNRRTYKTPNCLKRKLAAKKAARKSTPQESTPRWRAMKPPLTPFFIKIDTLIFVAIIREQEVPSIIDCFEMDRPPP